MLNHRRLDHILQVCPTVLFLNGSSPATRNSTNQEAYELLQKFGTNVTVIDLLTDADLRDQVYEHSNWHITPQLYVNGTFVGGLFVIPEFLKSGEYYRWLNMPIPNSLSYKLEKYYTPMASPWKVATTNGMHYLATAAGTLKIHSQESLELIEEQEISTGWSNSVEVLYDKSILVGTTDANLHRFGGTGQELEWKCLEHNRWINDLTTTIDRGMAFGVDGTGGVFKVSAVDISCEITPIAQLGSTGWSICTANNDKLVVVGLGDGRIVALDATTYEIRYSARLHDGAVTAMKPFGESVLSCGYDGFICKLDLAGMTLSRIKAHSERVWDIAVIESNIASIGGDYSFALYDGDLKREILRTPLQKMPVLVADHPKGTNIFFSDGSIETVALTIR